MVGPATICKSPIETIGFMLIDFGLEALAVYSSCYGSSDDEESWYESKDPELASSRVAIRLSQAKLANRSLEAG